MQEIYDDYNYIKEQWRKITSLIERKDQGKQIKSEEEAFEATELERAIEIVKKDKFTCEEAKKVADWF